MKNMPDWNDWILQKKAEFTLDKLGISKEKYLDSLEKRIMENKNKKNRALYGTGLVEDQNWSDLNRRGDIYNTIAADKNTVSQIRQRSRALRDKYAGSVNRESTGSPAAMETREGIHSRRWQDSDPRHGTPVILPKVENLDVDEDGETSGIDAARQVRPSRPGHDYSVPDIRYDRPDSEMTWKKPRLWTSGVSEAKAADADGSDTPLNASNYKKFNKPSVKDTSNLN